MAIKGLVNGGLNIIKSNKLAGGVLKSVKDLYMPSNGINDMMRSAVKRQANDILNNKSFKKISGLTDDEVRKLSFGIKDFSEKTNSVNYFNDSIKKNHPYSFKGYKNTNDRISYADNKVPFTTVKKRYETLKNDRNPLHKSVYNDYKNSFKGSSAGTYMANSAFMKEYLWDGASTSQKVARIGAIGAGYVGVNAVGRAITGGDLRHNRKGEDDIAGIPFI